MCVCFREREREVERERHLKEVGRVRGKYSDKLKVIDREDPLKEGVSGDDVSISSILYFHILCLEVNGTSLMTCVLPFI